MTMYRTKTLALLKDIWFRGAILIIKNFKFLKRRGLQNGKWTFAGFIEGSKEGNMIQEEIKCKEDSIYNYLASTQQACSNQQGKVGLEFNSMLDNLLNTVEMDDLVDIRENSAYVSFVQLIGGYINFEEDGYEILAKEYKRELKYSGGNLIEIQLREMIDRSILEVVDFFEAFPAFDTFQNCFVQDSMLRTNILNKSRHRYRSNYPESPLTRDDVFNKMPAKRQLTSIANIEFTKSGITMNDELNQPIEEINENSDHPKLIRSISKDNDEDFNTILNIPEFIKNDLVFCPIIDLFLQLNKQTLRLDKTEDEIVSSVIGTINETIVCLNNFCRPEFAKIKVISPREFQMQEEEEVEMKRLNFNIIK